MVAEQMTIPKKVDIRRAMNLRVFACVFAFYLCPRIWMHTQHMQTHPPNEPYVVATMQTHPPIEPYVVYDVKERICCHITRHISPRLHKNSTGHANEPYRAGHGGGTFLQAGRWVLEGANLIRPESSA